MATVSTVTFYRGNVPTPRFRPVNYKSWQSFLENTSATKFVQEFPYRVTVAQGCVDISTESFGTNLFDTDAANPVFQYMSVMEEDTLHSQIWCAFIAKSEYSAITKSWRLYYTVDWWTTMIARSNTPTVLGTVERAHVNDIVDGVATLQYTTETMEIEPSPLDCRTLSLNYPYVGNVLLSSPFAWLLVVISNKNAFSDSVPVPPIGESYDRGYSAATQTTGVMSQLPVAVFALQTRTGKIYKTDGETFVANSLFDFQSDYIGGFSMLPAYTFGNIATPPTTKTYALTKEAQKMFNGITELEMLVNLPEVKVYYNNTSDVNLPSFKRIIQEMGTDLTLDDTLYPLMESTTISEPTTFEDYLNGCIIKFRSQVYNPAWLDVQGQQLPLNYTYMVTYKDDGLLFSVTYDPVGSDCIVYIISDLVLSQGRYYTYNTSMLCPPTSTESYWANYTYKISATSNQYSIKLANYSFQYKAVSGLVSIADNLFSAYSTAAAQLGQFNLIGAASAIGQGWEQTATGMVNYYFEMQYESEKLAAAKDLNSLEFAKNIAMSNGAYASAQIANGFVSQPGGCGLPVLSFMGCKDEEVRYNLHLYGYATHLQPFQILKDHLRYSFNYIQCSDVQICPNRYVSAEARAEISKMFMSGVFLFSENDPDMDLDVINYPLSAGF